jgi:hypothetical protein
MFRDLFEDKKNAKFHQELSTSRPVCLSPPVAGIRVVFNLKFDSNKDFNFSKEPHNKKNLIGFF